VVRVASGHEPRWLARAQPQRPLLLHWPLKDKQA
jgi:hypothetical protein